MRLMSYRAGIIGTGGIAGMGILGMHDEETIGNEKVRASHAGGYHANDGIELVAAADPDTDQLATFGDAWDLPASGRYEDHRTMLEEADLDVVSVCTPTMFHHDHVVDAAEIGDPDVIWCEKPIASSVADAEAMCSSCEDNDAELLINHSFRFTSKLQALRDAIVEDDLLGEVHSVSTQYRMELMRNSTHVLDTLVFLLDSRPSTVSGYVTGENEAADSLDADQSVVDAAGGGHVVMADDTFVTVDCTIPRNDSSMLFSLVGSDGKLYLNNDDGEWRYWRLEDGDHVEEAIPETEGRWSWEEDYRDSFPNAVSHVVDLLDGEATNRSPGVEATRSLEIIVGFYLSHYTGSRIELPLEEPLRDVAITSW
jgi:predicted dehydrogenase